MTPKRTPSAAIPDPELRDFLQARARDEGVDLPPMGPTPRHWPERWRAPHTEPSHYPADNRGFLRQLWRDNRLMILYATILSSVSAVGITLIPWSMGRLLDAGLEQGITSALLAPSLVFIAIMVITALAAGINEMTDIALWTGGMVKPARPLVRRLASNGRAIKREMPAGDVATTLMTDGDYIGGAMAWTPEILGSLVSTVVMVVLMMQASVQLGLIVLIGLPLVVALTIALVRPLEKRMRVTREEQGKLTTISTDAVAGLRVLRGIGGEKVYNEAFRAQNDRVRDAGIRVAPPAAMLNVIRSAGPLVFMAIITGAGALAAFDGTITVGQFVSVFGYTALLRRPISAATNTVQMYARAWVGIKKMVGLLAVPESVHSSIDEGGATALGSPESGAADYRGAEGGVEGGGAPDYPAVALTDVDSGVEVCPGRMTALVCADPDVSAAMARRLARVTDEHGVLADGVDLRTRPIDEVRKGVLLSDAHAQLFAGSLRFNVSGARAHPPRQRGVTELVYRETIETASMQEDVLHRSHPGPLDEHLVDALRIADATDVLQSLAGGLDGRLLERGRNLSGGQRQRVALARAVAQDSPVLILVEPTSAVDSHTEARIADRLSDARRGRTTVIVTASPLMLEHCDEVVVLSPEGEEVARGTHNGLHERAREGERGGLVYRSIINREVGDA